MCDARIPVARARSLYLTLTISAITALAPPCAAQLTFPTARAAALAFALRNGLEAPADSVIIVPESVYRMNAHHRASAEATDIGLMEEAIAIRSAVLNPTARVRAAASVLECVRYDCATSTEYPVLFVAKPAEEAYGIAVHVMLFLPADARTGNQRLMQTVVVLVAQDSAGGWFGVRNFLGPSPVHPVRLSARDRSPDPS